MGIKFHFFGKNCIIDRNLTDTSDLQNKLAARNIYGRILFVNQIHGADTIIISTKEIRSEENLPEKLPKADAMVTNLSEIILAVVTADCAPILLFDDRQKVIAAVHAGWRGAKLGIIQSAIDNMRKLEAKNITAIIGPMIRQESYEVSQEFYEDFLTQDLSNKNFFVSGAKSCKYLFDLPAYVEKKLYQAKIGQIQKIKIDTYKDKDNFFSFRRSTHAKEADCGRNVSVIAINGVNHDILTTKLSDY
jgi:YfiH family protein